MASPLVSILLPHLRTPENNKALAVALDCLATNTGLDYELIIEGVEERRDIYAVLNKMAANARCDWIIPFNSDVFVAPGWLEPIWANREPDTITSPVMVECGAIGVNILNVHRNFGYTPETFRRVDFERWVSGGGEMPAGERAWFFPSLLNRETFLRQGGFDTSQGEFPYHLDMIFWNKWEADGLKFKRVRSFVYHLQQYSFEEEQQKPVRHGR